MSCVAQVVDVLVQSLVERMADNEVSHQLAWSAEEIVRAFVALDPKWGKQQELELSHIKVPLCTRARGLHCLPT